MNDTLSLLNRHRSIRHYTDDPLLEGDVRAAVAAGQRASTSSAIEAYCCIRIRSAETRQRLVTLTGGQTKVADAAGFFVICGDTRRHRLAAERAGRPYDSRLEAFLLAVIDATLFAQNMALAFESLGYGFCYVGGLRNRLPEASEALDLPRGVYPLFGICVGRPAETPIERPRFALDDVLHEERYPDDAQVLRTLDAHDEAVAIYYEKRGNEMPRWTERMIEKFETPIRTHLSSYYRGQGADLT